MSLFERIAAWSKALYGGRDWHWYTVKLERSVWEQLDAEMQANCRFGPWLERPYALQIRNVRFLPR